MPLALARPALGPRLGETAAGAAEKKLLDGLKKRVQNWDKIVSTKPDGKDPFRTYYLGNRRLSSLGTEAVLNALVLVNHDARRAKGVLSEPTRKALAHLWGQQQASGSWLWLNFGLEPWEKDGAYYGASLAAVAVGAAGKGYYEQADVQPKVGALKKYLRTQAAGQPLHHRVAALWASSHLPGVLTEGERKRLVEEVLGVQEADGGWGLPKLGKRAPGGNAWKAHAAHPEGEVSDGYATGLVVLALKRAGVAADDPKLRKGVAWLVRREREGTWPAHYLNRRRDPRDNVGKFMRDAATAFAVLALTEQAGPGPASGAGERPADPPSKSPAKTKLPGPIAPRSR
jgi:squalene-hopene/tetraprenyl-beta-curcumene cyclase